MGWKVDIEKQRGTEFWTNVYYVDTEAITGAVPVANAIVEAERAITSDLVTFTKYRISDIDPETELYVTQVLNLMGERHNETHMLPLFNVLRVDMSTATGRPSRKYLRGVLCEADIEFNDILIGPQGVFDVAYCQALEAIPELVDVDDQPFTAINAKSTVGMRQLRRGSRRTPVLP